MGGQHNKSSVTSSTKVPTNLPSSDSVASAHPCRLIEFEEIDIKSRFTVQFTTDMNRHMNSRLIFTEKKSYRRPDPRTSLFLTPKVLKKVEQALIEYVTVGWLSRTIKSGASSSFKVAGFKKSEMNGSSLDVAIIEAALTHIIDHLDDHPNFVAALGTTKIGYHDRGLALKDIGVRVFVVKGNTPDSEP
jgi:hypothetical protein